MPLYELRTYNLYVGKMPQAIEYYSNIGYPAIERQPDRLIGYFTGDIGALNQLIHLWKFEDDADRRAFWAGLYADEQFKEFVGKFRPLVMSQENKLMFNAPWGPTA